MNLKEFIKLIANTTLEKAKTFRGDWKENDPTSPNYIKNRPFYSTDPVETVLFDGTVTITDGWNENQYDPISFEVLDGTVYTVLFNNVEYSLIGSTSEYGTYIGSYSLWMDGNYVDSEPPFAYGNGWIVVAESGTYTIKISATMSTDIKIPEKYLPKMNYLAYDKYQELTDEQRYNVLDSIGAIDWGTYNSLNSSVVKHTSQSLTDAQKTQARENIGASNFSGSYNDLTNKPTIYTDVVRYNAAQSLTDDQKTQARSNIGASDFGGDYSDLTNAPNYSSSTDTLSARNLEATTGLTVKSNVISDEGSVTRISQYLATGIRYYPEGTDNTSPSGSITFANRDGTIILDTYRNETVNGIITSKDVQLSGIAEPTEDNDAANKSYVDNVINELNNLDYSELAFDTTEIVSHDVLNSHINEVDTLLGGDE